MYYYALHTKATKLRPLSLVYILVMAFLLRTKNACIEKHGCSGLIICFFGGFLYFLDHSGQWLLVFFRKVFNFISLLALLLSGTKLLLTYQFNKWRRKSDFFIFFFNTQRFLKEREVLKSQIGDVIFLHWKRMKVLKRGSIKITCW